MVTKQQNQQKASGTPNVTIEHRVLPSHNKTKGKEKEKENCTLDHTLC